MELSANFGVYEVAGASNESEWDIGATFSVTDEAAVGLRYSDGSDYVEVYFGVIFSFDTSILR